MVSSLFFFVGFALSNNKLRSFLHFGQVCFCCWQQYSTVGFSGSGSIVVFGGNLQLSVGLGGSLSILLFNFLVWFSSVFVALSLVDNTSNRKEEETNTIYYGFFSIAVRGIRFLTVAADCQFDSAM